MGVERDNPPAQVHQSFRRAAGTERSPSSSPPRRRGRPTSTRTAQASPACQPDPLGLDLHTANSAAGGAARTPGTADSKPRDASAAVAGIGTVVPPQSASEKVTIGIDAGPGHFCTPRSPPAAQHTACRGVSRRVAGICALVECTGDIRACLSPLTFPEGRLVTYELALATRPGPPVLNSIDTLKTTLTL